jgi:hypothetical protein
MATTNEDAYDALLAKIYNIVAAPDNITNVQKDTPFFSVCRPGIPISAEALDFGFTTMTPSQNSSAADFADFANDIPSLTGYYSPTGRKVYNEYFKVLRAPVLPQVTFTQAELDALEAAKNELWIKERRVDFGTGRVVEVIVDSLLLERYKEYEARWQQALDEYNNELETYLNRMDEPVAYEIWTRKEPRLRDKVNRAYNTWDAAGKGYVEEKLGFIANIQNRGSNQYFAALRNRYNDYKRADPNGGEYLFTKYFPQKFWEPSAGSWMTFKFNEKDVHKVDTRSVTNWGGRTGGRAGFWSWGGSVSRHSTITTNDSDIRSFDLSVELARIPIRRSWMDAGILSRRSWKFDNTIPVSEYLSDGANPPTGTMVSFPTSMIVARNLSLKIDMTSERNKYSLEKISGSLRGGWGPFSLRGNYNRETERTTHDFTQRGSGIECSGMQVIGFLCQVLPKSPDPDTTLTW